MMAAIYLTNSNGNKLTMRLKLLFLIVLSLPVLTFGQTLPKFKVKKWEFTNASETRTKRMDKALVIFEKVMNNTNFQKTLLKKTFKFAKNDPNRKLTTRQIVKKIYAAKESFSTRANNQADIYWNIRNKPSPKPPCRVIGSTSLSGKWINTYSCFIKKLLPQAV